MSNKTIKIYKNKQKLQRFKSNKSHPLLYYYKTVFVVSVSLHLRPLSLVREYLPCKIKLSQLYMYVVGEMVDEKTLLFGYRTNKPGRSVYLQCEVSV